MKIYTADNQLFLDVEVTEGYRFRQIMGDNRLYLSFSLDYYTEVAKGAWCMFNNEKYFLIDAQEPTKNNTQNFDYKLNFDTYVAYMKTQVFEFLTLDKNPDGSVIENSEPSPEFSLTGTPDRFLELLVDNMNQKDKERGWRIGEYLQSDEITIDFSHNFCYDVLGMLADKFETEWEVDGKTIHLRKVEKLKDSAIPLSYGMNKGLLPGITRTNYQAPIGRVIIKTSDRNIDQSVYGSRTLKMQKNTSIIHEGIEYVTDNTGTKIQRRVPVIQGNIVPEETLDLTKIYPRRVGTVTEVIEVDDSRGLYDFRDDTIPESLNFKDMIIPGETMIVVFQTGQMAGQGGDSGLTVDYKHTERRFLIKPNTDNGLIVPQGTLIPAVGDKYAVFHIMLPQEYISDAQNEAMFEAAKRLHAREQVEYTYKATLDEIYTKRNWGAIGGFLNIGYFVKLSVPEFFDGTEDIRIISVKEYVDKPMQPVIELSNSVTGRSAYSSAISQSQTQEQTNNRIRQDMINYAKRGWADTQQLIEAVKGMVDDFENSELSAEVLKGMIGLFGSESLQFQFLDVDWATAINPFISFDPKTKQLTCHTARIQHMTLGIDAVQPGRSISDYKFWLAPDYISPVLTESSEPYFLYLKASKTFQETGGRNTGEATFFISPEKIQLDDIEGYYTFWVGYLNSENMEGDRSFRTMYGYTEVLPGQITVDKLLSTSGALVIDLLNGVISAKNGATIQGNIKFISNNGDYQDVGDAINDTNEKIENIQVGGRNLLSGSNLFKVGYSDRPQITSAMESDGVLRIGVVSGGQGGLFNNFLVNPSLDDTMLQDGDDITISMWMKAEVPSPPFNFYLKAGMGYYQMQGTIETDYTQVYTTVKYKKEGGMAIHISPKTAGLYWLKYLQIEKGNKPSDWGLSDKDVQSGINQAKQDAANAQNTADTANQSVTNLNTYVDGAFKDGVVDNAEAKAIEKYLNTLEETMAQVEATYNKLYLNPYLEGIAKTNLLNAKINLFGARDNLKASINNAIADGIATPAEKADVDSKFAIFNTYLKAFQNTVEDANKAIQGKLDSLSTDKVNNIQVGGKNLLLNSNLFKVGYSDRPQITSAMESDGVLRIGVVNGGQGGLFNNFMVKASLDDTTLQEGDNITISMWMKCQAAGTIPFNFYLKGSMGYYNMQGTIGTDYSQVYVTVPYKKAGNIDIHISPRTTGLYWLKYIQIEKGNKPSDWSPNNKDIQNRIDETNQSVTNLNTYVDGAFKDGVVDNAEAKAIEKYLNTLDETMAQVEATYNKLYLNTYLEGIAKTNLLNAKVNLFGVRDNLKNSINNAIADGIATPAEKADVDSKFAIFNARLKDFQNTVEDANKAIQDKLDSLSTDKVNNIQVGGKNLLLNSNQFKVGYAGGAGISSAMESDGVLRIGVNGGVGVSYTYFMVNPLLDDSTLKDGDEITISMWMKAEVAGTLPFNFYLKGGMGYYQMLGTIGTDYSQVYTTVKYVKNGDLAIHISPRQDGLYWLKYIQIEKGNKPSDWSLASKEVQAQITALDYLKTALANRTEIDGGLLLTSLLKLGTFSGNNFTDKAGINGTATGSSDVVAWFGGTLQQAIQNLASIVFRMDGSGQLANGNIRWNSAGDTTHRGKFETIHNGNRIAIDPSTNSIKMYNNVNGSDFEILNISWEDIGFGLRRPKLVMKEYSTSDYSVVSSVIISTQKIGFYRYGDENAPYFEVAGTNYSQKRIRIGSFVLPTTKPTTSITMWRDGENLKITP